MLLGALLGAAHGLGQIPEKLKSGLVARAAITREVKAFVAVVQKSRANPRKSITVQKKRLANDVAQSGALHNNLSDAGVSEGVDEVQASSRDDGSTKEKSSSPTSGKEVGAVPLLPNEGAEIRQPPPAGIVRLLMSVA
jgi:hypothetical protein